MLLCKSAKAFLLHTYLFFDFNGAGRKEQKLYILISNMEQLFGEAMVSSDNDENDWNMAALDECELSPWDTDPDLDGNGNAFSRQLDFSSQHSHCGTSSPLPAQLHPAVSLGMHRVSSCYFSIAGSEGNTSVADLLSLVDERNMDDDGEAAVRWDASEVLYHDIMMHVMTFLDIKALAAFSQTARRPNFECFYFLQLQLQSSLLSQPYRYEYALEGTATVSRLAQGDAHYAQHIMQTYVDSNSTLRQMPLSHSMAYIRHLLERHGFQQHIATGSPSHTLASAALLITLIGAASVMGSAESMLPNMLKVGLAGGLMGAGVTASSDNKSNMIPAILPMRETAERMARMMQELPSQLLEQLHSMLRNDHHGHGLMGFPSSIASRIFGVFSSTIGPMEKRGIKETSDETQVSEEYSMHHPISPNPYEHLPETAAVATTSNRPEKVPSGCVGAYLQAVQRSSQKVISMVQQERKANYASLSVDEQLEVSRAFLEACSSDQTLSIVQDMVRVRKSVDVDAFLVGADGSETCALHTAAFHGAIRVLDFLCQGLSDDATLDGGMANVNVRDANGWTALHFAAGANSVDAVRILAKHGAQLALEANNGYTPYHWAQRLSNAQVAEELQKLGADQRFLLEHSLSSMAHRLFRMSRIQAA